MYVCAPSTLNTSQQPLHAMVRISHDIPCFEIQYVLNTSSSSFFNSHSLQYQPNPSPKALGHVEDPKAKGNMHFEEVDGKTFKKYAFCNMHFPDLALGVKICILPSKMHIFCIFSRYSINFPLRFHQYAFLGPWTYAKNMHFTW